VLLPKARDTIGVKRSIHTHDGHAFDQCLSNKEAVEGIAMVEWQDSYVRGVSNTDTEDLDAVERQLCRDQRLKRLSQAKLAQAGLNGYLPQAACAQENVVGSVFNQLASVMTQVRAIVEEPKERVCVSRSSFTTCTRRSRRGVRRSLQP
jgi:hypothetical protein